jgi:hypothetical protein
MIKKLLSTFCSVVLVLVITLSVFTTEAKADTPVIGIFPNPVIFFCDSSFGCFPPLEDQFAVAVVPNGDPAWIFFDPCFGGFQLQCLTFFGPFPNFPLSFDVAEWMPPFIPILFFDIGFWFIFAVDILPPNDVGSDVGFAIMINFF